MKDRYYHAGPFVVTVRQWDHDRALDADPARTRPWTSRSPIEYDGTPRI